MSDSAPRLVANLGEPIPSASTSSYASAEEFLSDLQSLAHRLKQILGTPGNPQGIAPAARRILELLRITGAQSVPQLARLRGTSRQNIQVIVNRLEQEGYVQSVPNSAHKRSDLISITPRGEALLHNLPDPQDKVAGLVAGQVSAPDLAAGVHLLRQVKQLLSELKTTRTTPQNIQGQTLPEQAHSPGELTQAEWAEDDNELPVNLL